MHTKTLEWEMHGVSTEVRIMAARARRGYDIVVEKDGDTVLTDVAPDGTALLRTSQELRARLQQLGYVPKPVPWRAPHLTGGVCWGPARPLEGSVVEALSR